MSDSDYSERDSEDLCSSSSEDNDPTYIPPTEESADDMPENDIVGVPSSLLQKSVIEDSKVYFHNSQLYAHGNDSEGEENLRRMSRGQAPIGSDGLPINLHHANQEDDGPLIELLQTFHQQHYSELHPRMGEPSQINRTEFDDERSKHWIERGRVHREQNREIMEDK